MNTRVSAVLGLIRQQTCNERKGNMMAPIKRSSDKRTPAACAVCYAQTALGVAARQRVHGMWVCDEHAEALREGRPMVSQHG